ncbi:carboxypeptidase-like regulatory domain-containing protein [Hymenobacter sp. BT664]|uniref:Carboxypeptidase-like regulatory domain-containing protein n=1 Tax=Hymenobacter montanus TaxID=2771359 RepID=A0A927BGF5_9BACT|nr:carboxypeptidase-like regulatory domain-containing protein [Hymenobacter montanus]
MAFANVAVRGSATSTGSNEQGEYQLRLPAGQYELVFQYVGYRPQVQPVRVLGGDSVLTVNVTLQPEAYNLGEVVVKSSDRDPAYAIIQQAQQWRAYYRREVAAYRARIYIKSLGRINETPAKIMGLFKLGPDIKKGIFYLSESLSDFSFTQPNVIKERMISSRVSGDSRGLSFNRASAGRNLGFYENLIKPAFSERGFVSPIASNAMLFYKYELVGSTPQNGVVVHKIRVIPRRRTDPVFSGFIYIVDGSWRIHSVDLNLDKDAQIDYVDELHVAQQYAPAPGNPNVWLIQSQQVRANLSGLGFKGSGYITAVLSNYANVIPTYPTPPAATTPPPAAPEGKAAPMEQETAAQIRKRKPDLSGLSRQVRRQVKRAQRDSLKNDPFARMPRGEVQLVEKGVNERDSAYWDQVRPVPLTAEERKDYHVKDSTEVIRNSRPYQDSLDKVRNKFEPINLVLGGYTYVNTFKKQSVTVQPVAQIFQYNTVEGAVLNAQAIFSQRTDDRRFVTLTPTLRYGFSSEQLNPSLTANWQLHPAKLKHIGVVAGRTIENFDRNSQLTPAINTIYTLFDNRNYAKLYRRDGAEFTYFTEPLNGLNLRAGAGYFDRRELFNTTDRLLRDVPGRAFTPNRPVSEELPDTGFGRSRLLALSLSVDYRPGQRYISRPDGKFNLGSKWPTFNVQGRLAVPRVLGAEVRYLLLQAGVRDNLSLGLLGTSSLRVNVGGFVGKQEGLTFADYRHFSGNQTILAGNFSSFQLLDYYRFSTNNTYLEAHYDHHFNGFFLNYIPLVRQLKWQEVVSLNYLTTTQAGHYVEVGVGIEHIIKVLRVDFYTALQSGERLGTGLRVGIGF